MSMVEAKLDPHTSKNVKNWLSGDYDLETIAEIRRLLAEDPKELSDAFYKKLTFGTGGMRGLMGVGTNRLNVYTVRAATQGLANYLKLQFPTKKDIGVCIGYDTRHNSRQFAEESAKVLAGNGIKAYLFSEIRPTPLISYACRLKKAQAAVMITASHNPPEYNGYKVYWQDGGQVVAPHDTGIVNEVAKIETRDQVKHTSTLNTPLIAFLGEEIDASYLKAIEQLQFYPEENRQFGKELKVVYTSLHGTGITLMPRALASWGFTHLDLVQNQVIPDGSFPTINKPNPEEKEALKLGIETLERVQGDILIATDPDADRVGVVVLHHGEARLLSGNQIAALCLEHILSSGKVAPNGAFIKTIGTTELFKAIADHYHHPCFNVLTGFKFIAHLIEEWENDPSHKYRYIFGGEESYGYLLSTYTRDKDAISSGALICEMASKAKQEGKTLVDCLDKLYKTYGTYHEALLSLNLDSGKEGQEKMEKGMQGLRNNPPTSLGGIPVVSIEDYETSLILNLENGKNETLTLPRSNVLLFWLKDRSKVMVRPSGTEPKVKFYCGVVQEDFPKAEERAKVLLKEISSLF